MDVVGQKSLEIMKKANFYNSWLFSMMKPYLSGNILEIGAGIGSFTEFLSGRGIVTAIDIDDYYIKTLKKLLPKGFAGYGDIEKGKYFFGSKKFDAIVCSNVLEHIKNDNKALGNMFRLLTKGGKLILIIPAHQTAYSEIDRELGHFKRYSKNEVTDKLKKLKFEIIVSRYLNSLGLIGWFVNGKIFRKKILPEGQLSIFDKIAAPFLFFEKIVEPPVGLSVFVVCQKNENFYFDSPL